jgi:hypothetical protein
MKINTNPSPKLTLFFNDMVIEPNEYVKKVINNELGDAEGRFIDNPWKWCNEKIDEANSLISDVDDTFDEDGDDNYSGGMDSAAEIRQINSGIEIFTDLKKYIITDLIISVSNNPRWKNELDMVLYISSL